MTAAPLVLGFHAVSDEWPWRFSVTPAALRDQVALLRRCGYRFATFGDAVRDPSPRVAALTFDDGFRSVATVAAPLLRELGVPATVFAVTGQVGTGEPLRWEGIEEWLGGRYEDELAGLSWDELAGLAESGWEVGSHTCSHPSLPHLDDEALRVELTASRQEIEQRLGSPCDVLAYPYGAHDRRVIEAARAAGYRAAATFPPHVRTGDALAVPRVGVYRGTGPGGFRLRVSPTVRRLRGRR